MRVLIAEDAPDSALYLSAIVRQAGHEPTLVTNGRAALDAWTAEPFPIVLSDWMMPEMDGLALTRAIRAIGKPYAYIVLITGQSGTERYLEGMDAGADDFVSKPVIPEELTARLRVAERLLSLEGLVNQLSAFVPLCQHCKRIRDTGDRWIPIELYLHEHGAAPTHGICPECVKIHWNPYLGRP